jgi:hypothetical protein
LYDGNLTSGESFLINTFTISLIDYSLFQLFPQILKTYF